MEMEHEPILSYFYRKQVLEEPQFPTSMIMGGSDLGKLLCVLNLILKEFGGFPYDSRRLDLKFKNEVRTYLNHGGQVGQEL